MPRILSLLWNNIHPAAGKRVSFFAQLAEADRSFQDMVKTAERQLEYTQYQGLEIIKHERYKKLKNLLTHAYHHSAFYRHLFDVSLVSLDRIDSEERIHLLPTVRKAEILATSPEFFLADNIGKLRREEGITSGSTGEPFRHFLDKKFNAVMKANLYRTWRWAGIDPAEPTIHCSAPHASKNTPHTLFLHPHEIEIKKHEFIEKIRASHAKILRGYPLTNFELLWMLSQEDCNITFTHAFLVGHVLPKGIRDFFKNRFGCEIYHYYASQETGPLASECEYHDGFHIHEESFIIEIVDDRGMPVSEGKRGNIVITSLINAVMPLIRYRIGDIGLMRSEPCACKRSSRRIWVEGRTEDLLIRPDGQCIYPGILRDILDEYFFAFQRYQIIQTSPEKIVVHIVPAAGFTQKLRAKAMNEIAQCIDFPMLITSDIVDSIPPLPNGKFQYVISSFWRNKFPKNILHVEPTKENLAE